VKRHCLVPIGLTVLLALASCGGPPAPREPTPPPAPERAVITHVVRPGDTLARLAELYYGDPGRAADIAAANDVPRDADLATGSMVTLRFEADELAAARRRQAALGPYNRGVAAMEQGDLAGAERLFRAALSTAGSLHLARYNLALVLNQRGRHDEAATLLVALVAARPDDPDFAFALGNARFYQTRYVEAAAIFADLLQRHPEHLRAAFGLARSLHEAGRRDEALAAWNAYLELDATSPWADEARRLRARLRGR
jgi:tetratricopeptide (TPR) repeat protein